MILIYVDEEYNFKGIKRFIADNNFQSLSPELILSLDGELALGTGCRGLIELDLTIKGKSGYSSNPDNGVNAITETCTVIKNIQNELEAFDDKDLGPTTLNIAYIIGGTLQVDENGIEQLIERPNIIADTVRIVLEIRPSVAEINANNFLQMIIQALKKSNLSLSKSIIRHDIAPWPISKGSNIMSMFHNIYAESEVSFTLSNRKLKGYTDAQMIAEKILAPTFIIGTGGNNLHDANENVPLKNIEDASKLYGVLLTSILK
jgi:acetylornithine deacetylase/succinyl-diaminopimelate desuccinylase-like protein